MEQMETTTTAAQPQKGDTVSTFSVFSITILRGREVIDREQLPFNAFTGVEAHAFAAKIAAAHGDGTRHVVVREEVKSA